ncbi:acyltransferase family protein [Brachybacterium sp.]|uniref:acyltransferase family protein n=1 Tax=Brachybacterium sp. TaxID=1891286 RepID=UPI002ED5B44D
MSAPLLREDRPRIPPTDSPARLHHLDALRGGALLLGVLLHALMPFLPGGLWMVDDVHDSWSAVLVVGTIHLFRMSLFMMLAGYFGRLVLQRRGAVPYLKDRLLRIGLPLVAFWPGLFALIALATVLDATRRGISLPADPAPGAPTGVLALPTLHLWFLLLLLEILLVVLAVRVVLVKLLGPERSARAAAAIGSALSSPAGLLLAAVPYAAGLLLQRDVAGSLIEPYTLVPVAGASVAYAGAFLVGWFLQARPGALERIQGRWILHLAAALVLTPVSLLGAQALPLAVTAAATALAGWAWVHALLGITARLVDREIPWVRYLADSSYWVYLGHLPLLMLAAVPLAPLDLPLLVKLALPLTMVLAVLLLSYDLCVRSTWIGAWLNGRRRPRALGGRGRRGV